MIEFVTLAEERLAPAAQAAAPAPRCRRTSRALPEIAPILRGAVRAREATRWPAPPSARSWISAPTPAILDYVNGAELARYSQQGVVTPDHTIRTKNWPLIVPAPEAGKLDAWKKDVQAAVDAFVARYHAYFARNNAKSAGRRRRNSIPCRASILVPGVGLFGVGASAKDAAIAADIAENTIAVITDAEAIGDISSASREADMFDVEYWSLEQAKLGKASGEVAGARRSPSITGGGSGIGAATAQAMAKRRRGSRHARPRSGRRRKPRPRPIGGKALAVACDVTDPQVGARGLRAVVVGLRRRRHRGLQCRRGLAGHHRRGRRRDPAQDASS